MFYLPTGCAGLNLILKPALCDSITTENDPGRIIQWQLNNHGTCWVGRIHKDHQMLPTGSESHSDTSFILAKCLSSTPTTPSSVICFLSLPQNPCVTQSQCKPKPKMGNSPTVTEVCDCSAKEAEVPPLKKKKKNPFSYKWATQEMTFGDSSLWYIFPHISWTVTYLASSFFRQGF